MTQQIGVVLRCRHDLPMTDGRIAEHGHAYTRKIGFHDSRQQMVGTPPPEADPATVTAHIEHYGTKLDSTINALTLDDTVIPRDMVENDWYYLGPPGAAETIRATDPHQLQHWYINKVSLPKGQTQTQDLMGPAYSPGGGSPDTVDPPPSSAVASAVSTLVEDIDYVQDLHWISKFSLKEGQGWELSYYVYPAAHSIQDDFANLAKAAIPAGGGFTLIELLVVVALIVIELSLLVSEFVVITWGLGNPDGLQWKVFLPFSTSSVKSVLFKSTDHGQTWTKFDVHPLEWHGTTGSPDAHAQGDKIRFWTEGGVGLMKLGRFIFPWRLEDPSSSNGFVSPAGKVHIQWHATSGTWILKKLGHYAPKKNLYGRAILGPYKTPAWVNNNPGAAVFKLYPVDPATGLSNVNTPDVACIVYAQTYAPDPTQYNIVVEFQPNQTATGTSPTTGNVASPHLMGITEHRPSVVEVVTASPPMAEHSTDIINLTIKRNRKHRMATANTHYRNLTGQWDYLQINEYVNMDIAEVQATDSPASTTTGAFIRQFCGHVTERTFHRDSKDYPGTAGTVEERSGDLSERIARKKMVDRPPYGGWRLRDAAVDVLQSIGIAPAYYNLSNIPDALVLKTTAVKGGKGHHSYAYSDDQACIHALDEMFSVFKWNWGVPADGILRAWPMGQVDAYPGGAGYYLLDDATYDAHTRNFKEIDIKRTLDGLYNTSIVHAKDASGVDRVGRAWYYQSIYGAYGSLDFIGDDFWDVFHAPAGTDAILLAQGRIASAESYSHVVIWHTDFIGDLQPNMDLRLNVSHPTSISRGTRFVVTDKQIDVETKGGVKAGCTFTLASPRTP